MKINRKLALCAAAVLMAVCFCIAGCGKKLPAFDAEAAFAKLLTDVKFDSALTDVTSAANIMLGDLPEGATARMYTADSPSEDALIMLTAANEGDVEALKSIAQSYIDERLYEAQRYTPDQVNKLQNAVVFDSGNTVIVAVTDDAEAVKGILN